MTPSRARINRAFRLLAAALAVLWLLPLVTDPAAAWAGVAAAPVPVSRGAAAAPICHCKCCMGRMQAYGKTMTCCCCHRTAAASDSALSVRCPCDSGSAPVALAAPTATQKLAPPCAAPARPTPAVGPLLAMTCPLPADGVAVSHAPAPGSPPPRLS